MALQEASVHDGRPDAAVTAEAMGDGYAYSQATAQLFRGREQGNALIWRRDTFQRQTPEIVSLSGLPTPRMTSVERTLLRAIPPQKRIAIRAESDELRVYVMHLDVIGFTHKLEQFRAILSDMAARPPAGLPPVPGGPDTFGPPRPQPRRRNRAAGDA